MTHGVVAAATIRKLRTPTFVPSDTITSPSATNASLVLPNTLYIGSMNSASNNDV